MAWIEGVTHGQRFIKDFVKIVTTANKDENGVVIEEKNWKLVYPSPLNFIQSELQENVEFTSTDRIEFVYPSGTVEIDPRKEVIVSDGTNTIDSSLYTVDYKKGIIKFNSAQTFAKVYVTFYKVLNDYLVDAINSITNRAIIKTTTTPVNVQSQYYEYSYTIDNSTSLTQYIEIYQPRYLVNPETNVYYQAIDFATGQTNLINNKFYVLMRVIDKWDEQNNRPVDPVYNENGELVQEGTLYGPWVKLAWFKDFEEVLKDELDTDISTSDASKGIILYHKQLGTIDVLPVNIFMSVNNDRIIGTVQSDPTIDDERSICSFFYIGRISNFENSVPDIGGNFAITVSSSTIPAKTIMFDEAKVVAQKPVITVTAPTPPATVPSEGYTSGAYRYIALCVNENNKTYTISDCVEVKKYADATGATKPDGIQVSVSVPANTTKVYVFRNKDVLTTSGLSAPVGGNGWTLAWTTSVSAKTLYPGDMIVVKTFDITNPSTTVVSFIDASTSTSPGNSTLDSVIKVYATYVVQRDAITGRVVSVQYDNTYGESTATGVIDVMMYKTKSGAHYQKHVVSFITTDDHVGSDITGMSRWTKKYHMSKCYIVHPYDGYRGWLSDVAVVNSNNINHLDELVVNKDQPNEERYKFFKITAPFNLLVNSPNSKYGIAIKKI